MSLGRQTHLKAKAVGKTACLESRDAVKPPNGTSGEARMAR
jgi:hypothetical protein